MAYFILIVLLLIAITIIVLLLRPESRGDGEKFRAKIAELNDKIAELESEKNQVKKLREDLEIESRNNFDSDTGRAVGDDLRRADDRPKI